jgi:DNA polymerase III subunit beta
LIEILSNSESKEIEMKFSTPNRAGIILPKEKSPEEEILMLIMPVMLNSYA